MGRILHNSTKLNNIFFKILLQYCSQWVCYVEPKLGNCTIYYCIFYKLYSCIINEKDIHTLTHLLSGLQTHQESQVSHMYLHSYIQLINTPIYIAPNEYSLLKLKKINKKKLSQYLLKT